MKVYSNDKDLVVAGARPYQIGGPSFWYKWLGPGQYDTTHIDTQVLANSVTLYKNDPRIFILDIEEFDLYGSNRPTAIQNMKIAKNAWLNTPRKIGWYGIIPEQRTHYWTCASSILTPDPAHMKSFWAWQKINNLNYQQLEGNTMNFYCPSCYAFYKPGQGGFGSWNAYVTALVTEALRLSRGKPVFPFVWNMYHPSCGGGPIDIKEWTSMIRHITSHKNLAGIIIWQEPSDKPCDGWRNPILEVLRNK